MISSDWQSQIFENKKCGSNLDPTGLNQAQNEQSLLSTDDVEWKVCILFWNDYQMDRNKFAWYKSKIN